MLNIIINEKTNNELFELWKKHYDIMNLKYNIINNISELSDHNILLTEYDFLFRYDKINDYTIISDVKKIKNDTMILYKNIKEEDLKKSFVIGKVFSVNIKNKKKFTTFEIPDYILYSHHDHTNYTKDGIKINFNKYNIEKTDISDDIVCLSMRKSEVAFEKEYYETNILYDGNKFNNIYNGYSYNIFVNKELKYGIIWHYKCACSTIINFFQNMNNIIDDDIHNLTKKSTKYKWNNYLQNIDMISFIRHPYYRFISAFFNKHINKLDNYYLNLDKYNQYINLYNQDTINNLALYLKNKNILDDHTLPITKMYYNIYINLKYITYDIENGVTDILHNFFSKYHDINNIKINYKNITEKSDNYDLNPQYKYYNYDDWIKYKNLYKIYPNYLSILDYELKNILYEIYKHDILKYGDIFINKIHNNIDIKHIIINNDLNKLDKFLPQDFDVNMYKELNTDLLQLNDDQAKLHYINHGINEKRLYKYDIDKLPWDFSCDMYRECNSDLKTLNDIECKLHYINHGINEKRLYKYDIDKLPWDFSCDMYRECNSDLKTSNDIECKLHYINHGINEKRLYKYDIDKLPFDFSCDMYRECNLDLKTLNDIECKLHYYNVGIKEHRKYK
jgi:hypothetical protein